MRIAQSAPLHLQCLPALGTQTFKCDQGEALVQSPSGQYRARNEGSDGPNRVRRKEGDEGCHDDRNSKGTNRTTDPPSSAAL